MVDKEGEIPFASVDDIIEPQKTKNVEIEDKTGKVKMFTIKKLTAGDLAVISRASKGDPITMSLYVTYRGLINPKLDMKQVEGLPTNLFQKLVASISEFSGLTEESLTNVENL